VLLNSRPEADQTKRRYARTPHACCDGRRPTHALRRVPKANQELWAACLSRGLAMSSRARAALNMLRAVACVAMVLVGCRERTEHGADVELAHGPVVRSAPQKLVVLGSSTSAGTGPRDPKDAYVPRYQAYLARRFPDFTLINLAVGGQTTYQIQPTGFVPPANRPAPAEGKNITAALALKPAAIIVNLPSNDAALGIPAAEQLDNFARVAKQASDAHVALWVTTPQPRNFAPAQAAIQRQVRRAILATYAPRTLEFWTPFAAADGSISPDYDCGDGVHLNAKAHTILLATVVAERLPEHLIQNAP
jgi:lysophospholipase L1-like esterase